MEPKFIKREAFAVIGLRRTFSKADSSKVPALWKEANAQWPVLEPLMTDAAIGACIVDGPDAPRFDYIAGVAATPETEAPPGMDKVTIDAQDYAVFTHRSDCNDLNLGLLDTIQYIFKTWLPASGRSLACSPEFELYDGRFSSESMTGEFDYYVPLAT